MKGILKFARLSPVGDRLLLLPFIILVAIVGKLLVIANKVANPLSRKVAW